MSNITTIFYSAIVVAFGGFIFGLDAALISGTVKFITEEFALTDLQVGAVVSAPGFGVIFALLITGQLCNAIGRRQTLIIIAFLYVFSAIASVLAPNFESLVAARFIGGLAFTSLSVSAMYIGEMAPAHLRGKLVSMMQINIVIGLSAAYFANYALLQASQSGSDFVTSLGIDQHTWRWMLGIEIIPAIIWFALLFTIPRSPRWLVMKGRVDEAKAVLNSYMSEQDAAKEMAEIEKGVALTQGQSLSNVEAFKLLFSKRIRIAALLGLTIAVVQQITGINAIMFYAPTVFEQVGLGTDGAFFQAIIVGLVSVVFTLVAVFLIDKLGRRPLVIWGLGTAAVSLLLCYIGFSQATYILNAEQVTQLGQMASLSNIAEIQNVVFNSDVEFKQALQNAVGVEAAKGNEGQIMSMASQINATLVLAGIMGFIAAFHFSIGPIMWVLFSEIFPLNVRGVAIPTFALITSIVSYLVQQFFPWQLSNMGAANIFLFYGVCAVIGFVLMFKLMPETKNKSIEEIEAFFAGDNK